MAVVDDAPETATVIQPATSNSQTPSAKPVHANPNREQWSGKVEFLLSAVGFAVGLGNVWRFPHLCYTHGGGAFLLPYILMMTCLGLPLFYLELAWGQYASLGPLSIWRCAPLFKGVGYTMVSVSLIVGIYYNVIISYTMFYFFASFTSELPWSRCNNTWNTDNCMEIHTQNAYYLNYTGNGTIDDSVNSSDIVVHSAMLGNNDQVASPAKEYWDFYVLGMEHDGSTGVGHLGHLQWHLTLCLLLGWIVVFLCILQGIKTSGKVVYFTATFPYVVLFILLLRGVTLPGAADGIRFYLNPDFSRLANVEVWSDAAVQILYSLGPGFGCLLTMGSFNKFNNNCCRDAIIITLINCGTSVFAGFVIFSVLGFMAAETGVSIANVTESGPGLAFIAYPSALAMMPAAPFWSLLFFFMLFTLGLDSQFAGLECIMTGLCDEFPRLSKYKKWVTASVCGLLFLLGLPCVTQGGVYVFQLLDKYATSVPLLVTTFTETMVISWVYGWRRFSNDLHVMMGFRPNYFWLGCWVAVTPIIILFILVSYCAEYSGMRYDSYVYPGWAEGVGWMVAVSTLAFIPAWMVALLVQRIGSWKFFVWTLKSPVRNLNLRSLIEPSDKWGPAREVDRQRARDHAESAAVRYNPDLDTVNIVENADIDDAAQQSSSEKTTFNNRHLRFTNPSDSYI